MAWLHSPSEVRGAVEAAYREKITLFGEVEVEGHLTPRERGYVVVETIDRVVDTHMPLDRADRQAATSEAAEDPCFDEEGRMVGPALSNPAVAALFGWGTLAGGAFGQVFFRGRLPSARRRMRNQPRPVPPMRGSPRQVAWAEDLRVQRLPAS